MKHTLVFALLLLSQISFGQFELGIKTGISSYDLVEESILIPNGDQNIHLSVADAGYGFHFGLYTRISIANIFIEPSFLFNSSTVDYNLDQEIFDTGVVSTIRSETYNNLDIPLLIGMKIGFLRIQGGPVAHIYIDSASELTSIDGYSQNFKEATYGLQGGIGLDILKLRIEVNYETNLSQFGDHITIGNTNYSFDERPGRIIASLGFKF